MSTTDISITDIRCQEFFMTEVHSDIWYGPVDEKKSTSRKAVHTFPDHSCVVALCFITELQWEFRPSGRVTGNSEVIQMLLL